MRRAGRAIFLASAVVLFAAGSVSLPYAASGRAGDSRALAAQLLPRPADLGSGWVRPWEAPRTLPWLAFQAEETSTEGAYWSALEKRLAAALDGSECTADRARELHLLRRPPAETVPEALRAVASRLRAATSSLRRAGGMTPEVRARAVVDAEAGATGGDGSAPAEECRRLAAPVTGMTAMTYLRVSDAGAAAATKNAADLTRAVDILTLRAQRLDTSGWSDLPDVNLASAARLEADLRGIIGDVLDAGRDQRAALADRSEMPALQASVKSLDVGDSSYLIQYGASAGTPGAALPNFTSAWMRFGTLGVEASLTGPMPLSGAAAFVRTALLQVILSASRAAPGTGPAAKRAASSETAVEALGLRLGVRDGAVTVLSLVPGSAAAKLPVGSGWKLVRANDQPVAGLTLGQIRDLMLATSGRPLAFLDFIEQDGTPRRVLLPIRE